MCRRKKWHSHHLVCVSLCASGVLQGSPEVFLADGVRKEARGGCAEQDPQRFFCMCVLDLLCDDLFGQVVACIGEHVEVLVRARVSELSDVLSL